MQSSPRTLFAGCYRCRPRARFFPRRRTSGIEILRPPCFSTSSTKASPADGHAANPLKRQTKLLILQPPQARKDAGFEIPKVLDSTPLEELQMNDLSKTLLTYESSEVGDATIGIAIASLKPEKERVSRARYNQLAEQLYKSFKSPQLRMYCEREKENGVPFRKGTKKAQFVNHILDKIWTVQVAEEVAEREDVVLKHTIESNKRDIFFLVSNDGYYLREWANEFRGRITVNVRESTISIQASQASIEAIEQRIDDLLTGVIIEDFDLSGLSRIANFNEALVSSISRTTRAFVERVDPHTLRINALDHVKIQDARRLLFTSVDLHLRTHSSLLYQTPPNDSVKGALFPVSENMTLPWKFRDQDWSRWRHSLNEVSREAGHLQSLSSGTIFDMLTAKPSNALTNSSEYPASEASAPQALSQQGNTSRPVSLTTYEANLCYHLFPSEPLDASMDGAILRSVREFIGSEPSQKTPVPCHSFPGIPFFVEYLHHHMNSKKSWGPPIYNETFSIKFLPSPWSSPDNFENYPPVVLKLPADSSKWEQQHPQVIALQSDSVVDVMLPSEYCDLRFLRQESVPLQIKALEGSEYGVRVEDWGNFMANSALDPLRDSKLRASPWLSIVIPDWLVQSSATQPPAVESIRYALAGMEYRRSVSVGVGRIELTRTAVDAGSSGGRWTEAKISLRQSGVNDLADEREHFEQLTQKAMDCVSSFARWMTRHK